MAYDDDIKFHRRRKQQDLDAANTYYKRQFSPWESMKPERPATGSENFDSKRSDAENADLYSSQAEFNANMARKYRQDKEKK